MNRITAAALMLALFFASTQPCLAQIPAASQATPDKIKVFINPEVSKPASIYYFGPGAALGLVGYLATSGDKEPKNLLLTVMEKENINISEIVRAEAQSQIVKLNKVEIGDAVNKDGTVKIDIVIYGFNKKNAFGSVSYPIVKLAMSYQDNKGEIIWKDTDMVSAHASNSDQGFTLDAYLAEPEKMREGLTRVVQLSLSGLVKSLQSELSK